MQHPRSPEWSIARETLVICAGMFACFATAPPARADQPGCLALAGRQEAGERLSAVWKTRLLSPGVCAISGRLDQRTGIDGQSYGIDFNLNLPDNWNGRFYFQGGGGTDGSAGSADGTISPDGQPSRLGQGYAVVSEDGGHDNGTDGDPNTGGAASFGADPQARIVYGYAGIDRVARAAKALVAAYYGSGARFSYFDGCSNGGRQAMVASQRFPDDFDGILAGDPGFNLPKAAVAAALAEQRLARFATGRDLDGAPNLSTSLSDREIAVASAAVTRACDALDGLADGIVDAWARCTDAVVHPALEAAICPMTGADASCLPAAKVAALEKIWDGPRNRQGQALYSEFQWDPGLQGLVSFKAWYVGPLPLPFVDTALNLSIAAGSLPLIFTTPPTILPTSRLAAYDLAFDADRDAPKIFATAAPYTESAQSFMTATSTDLAPFKAHGGRLMIYHGNADPEFSAHDTLRWYQALDRAQGGHAADFSRLFLVPGLGHCNGGPSTSAFDAFGALVAWVEHGRAPDSIAAIAPLGTPWPGRTRILCAYPRTARYRGQGSIETAASFACVQDPDAAAFR